MAHVDDLTFVNAAQILNSDLLYVGRPSDGADPDKRTDIEELITRIMGADALGISPFYSSGVWTPVLHTGGAPLGGVTYGTRSGTWVKVGGVVAFGLDISITSINSPPSSQVRIAGLPHTRSGVTMAYAPYIENIAVPGNMNMPLMDWATTTELRLIALNTSAGPASVQYTNLGANARIKAAGIYMS